MAAGNRKIESYKRAFEKLGVGRMPKNVFVGIGTSKNDDAFAAGKEAAEAAVEKMKKEGGDDPNFGLVFCSGGKYGKDDRTIKKFVDGVHSVLSKYDNCKWIGCTTAGEITPDGVMHSSATVTVLSSKFMKFGVGVGKDLNKEAFKSGKEAITEALRNVKIDKYIDSYISYLSAKTKSPSELIKQRQFAVLTLPAGFTMKEAGWEDDMLDGIKSVVGATTPIVGGSAADDLQFVKNYQFENGNVYTNSVILAVLFSNVNIGFGLEHGFEPTDKITLITKAKGNIVYELNNRPAVDVYAEILGVNKKELTKGLGFLRAMGKLLPSRLMKWAALTGVNAEKIMRNLPSLQLIIQNSFGIPDINGNYLPRVPKSIIDGKYLEFYNKMFNNMPLTLLKVNEERTLKAPQKAIDSAIKESGEPALVLIFDCVGRTGYIGPEKTQKIYNSLQGPVKKTQYIGFFTLNEQGFEKNSPASGHTFTCAVMSISDKLITDK